MSGEDDIMPIEVPDDEELFNSEEVTEEAEAPVEEAKAEEVEETKEAQPEEEKPDSHRVPLNELLNERERRQKAEAQAEAMQQHWEAMQQQGQPQEWPDIFENPEFYQNAFMQQQAYMQQAFEQMQQQNAHQMQMARMEYLGELSLREAKSRDPETYQKAFAEVTRRAQAGDPSWRTQVLQSEDPGATLLNLYKTSHVAETVGEDPEAYFQRRLGELKNDPKALAEVLGQPQAPNIDLPPSLTKAGGGSQGLPHVSGRDLWEEINS